jgi:hypothetical protein
MVQGQLQVTRPRRFPDLRAMILALVILVLVPIAAIIVVATNRNNRLLGGLAAGWTLFSALGFIVFLAAAYVTAYVVSAGWHDAQNSRQP